MAYDHSKNFLKKSEFRHFFITVHQLKKIRGWFRFDWLFCSVWLRFVLFWMSLFTLIWYLLTCIEQLAICHGLLPICPNKIENELSSLNQLFNTQHQGPLFMIGQPSWFSRGFFSGENNRHFTYNCANLYWFIGFIPRDLVFCLFLDYFEPYFEFIFTLSLVLRSSWWAQGFMV